MKKRTSTNIDCTKTVELIQSQADRELWENNQDRINELEKWKSIFSSVLHK